jgi:hypothetical protein
MKLYFIGDALFFGPALLIPCRPAAASTSQWDNLKHIVESVPDGKDFEDVLEAARREGADEAYDDTKQHGYDEGFDAGVAEGVRRAEMSLKERRKSSTASPKRRT